MTLAAKLYFRLREYKLLRRYLKRLRNGNDLRLTTAQSKTIYEAYDDSEQKKYKQGTVRTLHNGRIQRVSFREIREIYLYEICVQIDELLKAANGKSVSVLEVGCGNCINAALLSQKYQQKIKLHGFDISPKRLEVSKEYWGKSLDGVSLTEMSATEIQYPDKSFDLVFSMHVLEQIPYLAGNAVDEMLRVSRRCVVFVEPTYEFGNPAQRLKLVLNDQLRTLLPELERRNLNLQKSYPLQTLANPTNPTGVHVVIVDS